MKSKKKRGKTQPLYRPGDIVACWDKRVVDGIEVKKAVVGWVERVTLVDEGIVYYVRWSDRLEQNKVMRVEEDLMPPLRGLVDMIRNGEIK